MNKRVVGVYDHGNDAIKVIEDLQAEGYERDQISVIARDPEDVHEITDETGTKAGEGAAAGAATGGVLGGLTGFLAGVGALAIPGIGPILAAGPIAATVAGAVTGAGAGGIAGALVGMGIPDHEAKQYETDIKEGKILVLVDDKDGALDGSRRMDQSKGIGRKGVIGGIDHADRPGSLDREQGLTDSRTVIRGGHDNGHSRDGLESELTNHTTDRHSVREGILEKPDEHGRRVEPHKETSFGESFSGRKLSDDEGFGGRPVPADGENLRGRANAAADDTNVHGGLNLAGNEGFRDETKRDTGDETVGRDWDEDRKIRDRQRRIEETSDPLLTGDPMVDATRGGSRGPASFRDNNGIVTDDASGQEGRPFRRDNDSDDPIV
ncbi:general stress protein [Peribacillus sp. SCS-37]|uniref:general stress protein n=1 Tax=Paraperibacillus esterisolvens TaxID=3115296 RepID=UPI00390641F9